MICIAHASGTHGIYQAVTALIFASIRFEVIPLADDHYEIVVGESAQFMGHHFGYLDLDWQDQPTEAKR